MISRSVARLTRAPVVTDVVVQVDEHPAALDAVIRHVFQAEMAGEAAVRSAVTGRVVLRADEVDAGPVAVVVDRLFDTIAVGVEFGADVRQRIPLRRVLQRERDDVIGPDVDVFRIAPVRHLAHPDVVEDARCAVHVLGRRDRGRVAALVQRRAAGKVERQAQAEAAAFGRPRVRLRAPSPA